VASRQVGEFVMEELRHLDEVAYVRFASVYRSFQDIEAFRDEVCARFPEIAALKPGIVRAGAAIGPHTGPKGLGVALIRA